MTPTRLTRRAYYVEPDGDIVFDNNWLECAGDQWFSNKVGTVCTEYLFETRPEAILRARQNIHKSIAGHFHSIERLKAKLENLDK